MLEGKNKELAHKISTDTARAVSDYIEGKAKRLGKKVDPLFVYMAALGGTVGVIASLIEAVQSRSPELAAKLREDIIEKIGKAGLQ